MVPVGKRSGIHDADSFGRAAHGRDTGCCAIPRPPQNGDTATGCVSARWSAQRRRNALSKGPGRVRLTVMGLFGRHAQRLRRRQRRRGQHRRQRRLVRVRHAHGRQARPRVSATRRRISCCPGSIECSRTRSGGRWGSTTGCAGSTSRPTSTSSSSGSTAGATPPPPSSACSASASASPSEPATTKMLISRS